MTFTVLFATISIAVALLASLVFSLSSNQCSSCHGSTYNQQLDILEGNSQNIIPSTIVVGQTTTVTVAIQNINNAPPLFNQFLSVTVTLSSQNGHFSVSNPTFNIGTLGPTTATATWQITGISQGPDELVISASAITIHEHLFYSDSYLPNPLITVAFNPNLTLTPTPAPTPIPTLTPLSSTTPQTSTNPPVTNTPIPTHAQTNQPTNTAATPTRIPTSNSTPSTTPTTQPNPTTSSHSFNSQMLYIHPPLAITGYVLTFLFAILVLKINDLESRITKITGRMLWLFTFLGLLTGMLWAQFAWGSYWSWDPKETMTLALFLSASASQLFYVQKKYTTTKLLSLLTCGLVVITGLSSFIFAGFHSYL